MSLRSIRWLKNKVEMSAHALPGTQVIAETRAGPVYRMPLNLSKQKFDVQIPGEIVNLLLESRSREQLASNLNWNRFDIDSALGRPSSAFLVHLPEGICIDFIEIYDDTGGNRQPHDFIRDNVGYSNALSIPINPLAKFLSGHIAPLTISTTDMSAIFLLDAFRGSNPDISNRDVSGIMAILRGNRILPITSDGYVI